MKLIGRLSGFASSSRFWGPVAEMVWKEGERSKLRVPSKLDFMIGLKRTHCMAVLRRHIG